MIYVLISGGKAHEKTEENEKRDCRIVRQPLSLLSKESKEYIEKAKNVNVRFERKLAYTSLFLGLKVFFDVENAEVRKTEDGKPYLIIEGIDNINQKNTNSAQKNKYQKNEEFEYLFKKNDEDKKLNHASDFEGSDYSDLPCSAKCSEIIKNIFVSISHSNGVSAVCLSDEGEIGIDIQAEIDNSKAEKLNGRFFHTLKPIHTDLNVKYFICEISDEEAYLEPVDLACTDLNSETVKWAMCESLIKLSGGGFGDLKMIENISQHSVSELKVFTDKGNFYIAVSKLRQ